MAKISFKPGNMLYPLPVVMVSVADKEGNTNIITIAWAGTVCTNPPMVSISVRPSRYSHHMLVETGEFVVNLTTQALAFATDYCGVRSGRDVDKWKEMHLTPVQSDKVKAPCIAESPVNIECRVGEIYVVYTGFKNTVTHIPTRLKLLPIKIEDERSDDDKAVLDFEPETEDAIDLIIPKYITSLIYGAMIEAVASENAARMQAMDNATNNADEIISSLSLLYNRARQSAITQELTEIIAGAQAIS